MPKRFVVPGHQHGDDAVAGAATQAGARTLRHPRQRTTNTYLSHLPLGKEGAPMFERVAAVDDGRPYEIGAEAFADVLQDGSLQDLERLCEKALVPSAGANRGQLIQRLQARRCHCVGGETLCILCLPSRLSARVDGRPAASAFHDAIIAIIGDASVCWLPRPPQVWHSHAAQRMTDWRMSRDRDVYEARSRRPKLMTRAGAISGAADVREPHGAAAILAAEVRPPHSTAQHTAQHTPQHRGLWVCFVLIVGLNRVQVLLWCAGSVNYALCSCTGLYDPNHRHSRQYRHQREHHRRHGDSSCQIILSTR